MRAGSRTETPRERLRKCQDSATGSLFQLSPREATGWLRQRSRSSLLLFALLCSVGKKSECYLAAVPSAVRFACRCCVYLFAHASPTMPSISLVLLLYLKKGVYGTCVYVYACTIHACTCIGYTLGSQCIPGIYIREVVSDNARGLYQ